MNRTEKVSDQIAHEVSADMFWRIILLNIYFLGYYTHAAIPHTATFTFGTVIFFCAKITWKKPSLSSMMGLIGIKHCRANPLSP